MLIPCSYHTAHRTQQISAVERLRHDLLHPESLCGCTGGAQSGSKLARDRDDRRIRMCCMNIADPQRSGVFGHVHVDDQKIRRTIKVSIVRPADADTISRLAQPLLQQSTREVVFLVYHDVQSVLILLLSG